MTQSLDLVPPPEQVFRVRVSYAQRIIHLAGELDIATVPLLHDAVTTLLEAATAPITLDLSDLTFIDSQGLDLIERIRLEQQRRGTALLLAGVGERIQYVFTVAGLGELFTRTR